ncbi:MAG: C_GCAxxG_C_C family protein [Ruminococcaceae bacterium]|nr:C_GCAxxG_C_C family protein [Oscillospiraceae bacterium]
MTKREQAIHYHEQGYNCAQSVLLAFCDELGLSPEAAAQLSLPFGSGMSGLRDTCGALTGAFMVIGLAAKSATPPSPAEKAAVYQKAKAFAQQFQTANGSMACRDLLAMAAQSKTAKDCPALVADTAEQLEAFLQACEE